MADVGLTPAVLDTLCAGRPAATLLEIASARAVHLDDAVLTAEPLPGGQRPVFRGPGGDGGVLQYGRDGIAEITEV
ncbi:hypothetical protein [Mycolicibacterium phlei]|nr:hypothetical protein [Mycolicibacterium phlei]EID18306.1 hypothetical protein MPHLEI_00742 [Mycolicibacterium phlei RIVM601174]MBF4190553.1 hypothetical protein [Mycolicibacterium phlei]